jgi:tetratricopeptide (TPR) repeat protein
MSDTIANGTDLTKQNPWPGLRAFGESDRDFFFGRERETAELLGLVQRSPVVVLYGQSGLGKTSLLQAGLFPRLKELNFLPFRVRLDHADNAPPLARQITLAVAAELDRAQIKGPRPSDGETLWEYFHRVDVDFWGPRNRLLTPVIVLDQFEEIFTLGHHSEISSARVAEFQKELEGQLEHRPPDAVRERLDAHPDEALRYDLKKQGVKFVITLREDFLPDLDPWRQRMPSLLPNRFRLEPMTGDQALEVVQRGGRDLVDEVVARDIVDFVSASQRKRSASALEEREVEPALLSVVCDALNLSRIEHGNARITADLLTAKREEIIQDFYERTFQGIDPGVRDWVEDRLLTSSGYRDRAALDDALRLGLPESDFDLLVNRRILHREERDGVIWLELTHDLLTDPAARSRAVREQRIQAEAAAEREKAAAEREAQVRSKLRRTQSVVAVCGVLLVIAAVALDRAIVSSRNARTAESKAVAAEQTAVQEKDNSLHSYQTATKMTARMELNIDDTGIPTATAVNNIQEVERAYSDLSHQGNLADLQHAQFLTKAADAYYRVGYITPGLDESQQAIDLLQQIGGPEVPADVLALTRAEALYSRGDGLLTIGHLTEAHRCFDDAIKLAAANQTPDLKQAAARVNVLSRIDLARLDDQGWAYPSANAHLRDALEIIKANMPDADKAPNAPYANEIRWWNALALQEMGRSQIEDADSPKYFADATAAISDLMARDPQNLRWKRTFAHITFARALNAMDLGKLDDATQLFEQSQATSEDLCNRDPLNLEWRLGLLQSRLGLGLVHKESGEWDLSEAALKEGETGATQLLAEQPTWTQALYDAAEVAFGLGDVFRAKYNDESHADEKKVLLDQENIYFSKALKLSEQGIEVTPEDLDFVRLAALAIQRQGLVLGTQGEVLDVTVKGNQDEKTKDETEALEHYDEAFAKLRPIQSAAKDHPEILGDEAYLYFWTGNAMVQLNRPKDAEAAYLDAVAPTKVLIQKKPVGDNYQLLSWIYEAAGDTYESANDLDKAVANDRLAEQAIHQALVLTPGNTGYHVQDALVESKFFEIALKRNDLSAAVDALDRSITTSLAGLTTDYSDLSLNQDIDYLRKQLVSVQTAINADHPVAGSAAGPGHLSAEQSKALLGKIDLLLLESAPDKLLDRNSRQLSWSMRPLMPGAWRNLADAERGDALKSVLALNKNLKPDQVWGIRRLPLGFYDGVALYEAQVVLPDGTQGIAAFLQSGTKVFPVDGTLEPVHTLNAQSQLKLDDVARATDYMRFYVGMMHLDGGRFNVIDSPDDINWSSAATADQRASVVEKIKPLTAEPISDRGWQAIGTVQYNGYLERVSLHLSRFGEIEVENDRVVTPRLPVSLELFDDGIRVSRSIEAVDKQVLEGKVTLAEQQLKKNPNDPTALAELPQWYFELERWKEAVDAQKAEVAAIISEPKHDADWSSSLDDAYVSLAWFQLFSRDFEGSLASTEEARKLDATDLTMETNHAHALLFLGRLPEAEAIYLQHRGEKMSADSDQIWNEVVFGDFDDLQKAGIITKETAPEVAHIRELLKPPSN